ncbi:unnamed protein product [Cuscuta campestris]|uniref:Uncharacterized protein n=1 Tax=Cuscuta campestris TaxID=132261 RepID=A0A484KH54_9ASTE|nr:unnamed protein product [Cuscuta campestris]
MVMSGGLPAKAKQRRLTALQLDDKDDRRWQWRRRTAARRGEPSSAALMLTEDLWRRKQRRLAAARRLWLARRRRGRTAGEDDRRRTASGGCNSTAIEDEEEEVFCWYGVPHQLDSHRIVLAVRFWGGAKGQRRTQIPAATTHEAARDLIQLWPILLPFLMSTCIPHFVSLRFLELNTSKRYRFSGRCRRTMSVAASVSKEASNYIPEAPIFLPEGPWQQDCSQ